MQLEYTQLYPIHVTAVTLSFSGFFVRLVGVFFRAAWVRGKVARTLPHVIDSILLASAIGMLIAIPLNPVEHTWLLAKMAALVVYIGLGILALRPDSGDITKRISGLSALAVFIYIVSVALAKSPAGFLSAL